MCYPSWGIKEADGVGVIPGVEEDKSALAVIAGDAPTQTRDDEDSDEAHVDVLSTSAIVGTGNSHPSSSTGASGSTVLGGAATPTPSVPTALSDPQWRPAPFAADELPRTWTFEIPGGHGGKVVFYKSKHSFQTTCGNRVGHSQSCRLTRTRKPAKDMYSPPSTGRPLGMCVAWIVFGHDCSDFRLIVLAGER